MKIVIRISLNQADVYQKCRTAEKGPFKEISQSKFLNLFNLPWPIYYSWHIEAIVQLDFNYNIISHQVNKKF